MPEKLLTIEEASNLLGISVQGIKKLVEKGDLPAYKIGGEFLRFRKEQIEAIRDEISAKGALKALQAAPQHPPRRITKKRSDIAYSQSFLESVLDFFYFNDFYILSGVIIACILWIIFK